MRPARIALGLVLGAGFAAAAPAAALGAAFQPISTAGFGMARTGFDAGTYANVAALEKKYAGVATIGSVVENGAKKTRPLAGSPGPGVVAGFRWDEEDSDVPTWIPQGITGSADAVPGGIVDGHRELVVSWYSTAGKGSRVTFINADALVGAKYRHVLLVEPKAGGGFGIVESHAGGIAWYGNYLYVAQTNGGLRVFDLRHIVKVPADRKGETLTYQYLLPQVGMYLSTTPGLVFSYVSLDRSGKRPALVTGEFRQGEAGGRIVRWKLNGNTGLLGPKAKAKAAYTSPVGSVQGALMLRGKIGTISSAGETNPGTFTTGAPGQTATGRAWAAGGEDMTFAGTSGRIYSLTEYAGARTVFAVNAGSFGF
jgi:hypothetical protein